MSSSSSDRLSTTRATGRDERNSQEMCAKRCRVGVGFSGECRSPDVGHLQLEKWASDPPDAPGPESFAGVGPESSGGVGPEPIPMVLRDPRAVNGASGPLKSAGGVGIHEHPRAGVREPGESSVDLSTCFQPGEDPSPDPPPQRRGFAAVN